MFSALDIWAKLKMGIFKKRSARANQRNLYPCYKGRFHLINGRTGEYTVDDHGLRLFFPQDINLQLKYIEQKSDGGWMRQAIIPPQWDGNRVVIIISGAGVYAASYANLIAQLLSSGISGESVAVLWEDLCGLGFSLQGNNFASIQKYNCLVDPQIELIKDVKQILGVTQPKVTLLGFSLGGQIALHIGTKASELLTDTSLATIDSILAVAPLVKPAGKLGSTWVRFLIKLLSHIPLIGNLYIERDLFRSSDYQSVILDWYSEDYLKRKSADPNIGDPFFDDSILLHSLREILQAGYHLLSAKPPVNIRTRIMHSKDDRTCCYEASEQLFRIWEKHSSYVSFCTVKKLPHQVFHLNPKAWGEFYPCLERSLHEVIHNP